MRINGVLSTQLCAHLHAVCNSSVDAVLAGEVAAVCTAPISKAAISAAGFGYRLNTVRFANGPHHVSIRVITGNLNRSAVSIRRSALR